MIKLAPGTKATFSIPYSTYVVCAAVLRRAVCVARSLLFFLWLLGGRALCAVACTGHMRRGSVAASRRGSVVQLAGSSEPELPAEWLKTLSDIADPICKVDPALGEATRANLIHAVRGMYLKEEEQHEAAMEQMRSKVQWQLQQNEKKMQTLRRAGSIQGDHLAVQLEASQQLVVKLQEELKSNADALEQMLAAHAESEKKLKWKLSMLDGGIAAAEHEREQYIAHVGKKAVRRMKNADLLQGFSIWRELADEQKRMRAVVARFFCSKGISRAWLAWSSMTQNAAHMRKLLGAATTRLARPGLAASLSRWKEDWEYAREMAAQGGLLGRIAMLEEELKKARASAFTLVQEEVGAEHQRHVEQLSAIAVKRMRCEQLSYAWEAWRGQWEVQKSTRRRLAAAANMLTRPALSASLAFWKQDWQTTAVTFIRRASLRTESSLYARIATLEAENRELQRDRANALEDVAEANRQRIDQMAARSIRRMINSKMARAWEEWLSVWEDRKRQLHVLGSFIKRLKNQQVSRCWGSWVEQRQERDRMRRVLHAAAGRLRSPKLSMGFQHWKQVWERSSSLSIPGLAAALTDARTAASNALAMLEQSNEEISRVRREYEALRNDAAERLTHEASLKQTVALQLEEIEQQLSDERQRSAAAERHAERLETKLNSKEAPMSLQEKAALVAAMNARMKALASEFASRSRPGHFAPNLPRRTLSTPKLVAPTERDQIHHTLLELSVSQQGAIQ